MPLNQLRRVRWAVRATLVLGVAASVVANVLHARTNPVSQAIAAWPPLALLLTVELISRVPVHRRSLAALRLVATATIAGIAAWVSYWHMAGVAARYGETGASPYLLPLSVDGLIVVASICLVELGSRIAAETADTARTGGRSDTAPPAPDQPPTATQAPAPAQPPALAQPAADAAQQPTAQPAAASRPAAAVAGSGRSAAVGSDRAAARAGADDAAAGPTTAVTLQPVFIAAAVDSRSPDTGEHDTGEPDTGEPDTGGYGTGGYGTGDFDAAAEADGMALRADGARVPTQHPVEMPAATPDRARPDPDELVGDRSSRRGARAGRLAPEVLDAVAARLTAGRPVDPDGDGTTAAGRAGRRLAARPGTFAESLVSSAAKRTGTRGEARTAHAGDPPDGDAEPGSRRASTRPRRSAAETLALAAQIKAERPEATDAEIASRLNITPRRLREVRREMELSA